MVSVGASRSIASIFARGRHHVLDGDRFEVETGDENALVLLRHELPGFQHEEAQLLHRQALRPLGRSGRAAATAGSGRTGDDPQRPCRRFDERLEHVARRKGGLLG